MMINPAEITAADLIDPEIHKDAPFYGMDASKGLNEQLGLKPLGPPSRSLRFAPTYDRLLLDEETGATWETFDLGPNTDHWYHGEITINEDRVGEYFRGIEYDVLRENLIPDMFLGGALIVSEQAKNLIEHFAAGFCYFAPLNFIARQTGKQSSKKLFHVYLRRTLSFKGPPLRPVVRPEGERTSLVLPNVWTGFCNNEQVQQVAKKLPIFSFNRAQRYPVFSASLFQKLKKAGISGLLESTYFDTVAPDKSGKPIDFETVFPLDPTHR